MRLESGLYVTATPLGNLGDFSSRGREVLGAADLILCEDTRRTRKLLSAMDLHAALSSFHDHNARQKLPKILARLESGEAVALVCDAGTPLVSDPGYELVRTAIARGLPVHHIPGPSAPISALVLSGLPPDRFMFAGFLPSKSGARRKQLADLAAVPATLLFFESPQRLGAALSDMAETLGGERSAAVCREMTKIHEEIRRGSLAELAAHYDENGPPKGEVTLVVGPPGPQLLVSDAELDRLLIESFSDKSVSEAVRDVAAASGHPRRHVYQRALALTRKGQPLDRAE